MTTRDDLTPALRTAGVVTVLGVAIVVVTARFYEHIPFATGLFGMGMFGMLGGVMMFCGYGIIRSYQRSMMNGMKLNKRTYRQAILRNCRRRTAIFRYAKNQSVDTHIRIWAVSEAERLNHNVERIFYRGVMNKRIRT